MSDKKLSKEISLKKKTSRKNFSDKKLEKEFDLEKAKEIIYKEMGNLKDKK
jgi:hypothetical protein